MDATKKILGNELLEKSAPRITMLILFSNVLFFFFYLFAVNLLLVLFAILVYWYINGFNFFPPYAHRKCVQHWCNEKGDITCEICHQVCF